MKKIFVVSTLLSVILFSCRNDDDASPDNLSDINFTPLSDTLIVNPHFYSPLTALSQHSTTVESRAEVIVKGFTIDDQDLIHQFQDYKRNHEISILGLYPNFNNTVFINYYDRNGNLIDEQVHMIQTDSMNFIVPTIEIDILNQEEMEPGFNLVSYLGTLNPNVPFIFDNKGRIRWYLDFSDHPELNALFFDNGIEKLKNGNFYFGSRDDDKIFEVSVLGEILNRWDIGKYSFHHNVYEKENGNFILTSEDLNSVHLNGVNVVEDFALEIDRSSGAIITEWDLKESLDENRTALTTDLFDWFHGNAIIESPDNSIIISGRTQGFAKLNYNNEPIWIIANHRDWDTSRRGVNLNQYLLTPVDQNGNEILDTAVLNGSKNHPDFEWPWYGHAPLIMPNGNIMVFDNGDKRNYTYAERYSRAVEYKIDEQQMTIQQVWSYGKARGEEAHSRVVSDVDYYPNSDNVVFSPGFGVENGNGTGGKIIEIDYSSKTVVFEARITVPGIIAFHRTEKVQLY